MVIVPVNMDLANKMNPTLNIYDFFMSDQIAHCLRFGCLYGELSPVFDDDDSMIDYVSINASNVAFRINRFIIESKEKVFMEIDLEKYANGLIVYTAMHNSPDSIVFEPRFYYVGLTDYRLITVDARSKPEYRDKMTIYRELVNKEVKPWARS